MVGSEVVGRQARQGREQSSARDGRDDPGRTPLCVATQTSNAQCENGREDARLEEEHQREHGDAAFPFDAHRAGNEHHDHGHEHQEDETGLDKHEQAGGGEPTDGEESLADRVPVRGR